MVVWCIADSSNLLVTTGWDGNGTVPTVSPRNVDIVWTDADGLTRTSEARLEA